MTSLIPGHLTCQHRIYNLSCMEYDELYERAKGRCEICGIKEAFAPQAKLFIDHDHKIGSGVDSIRGLLCGRCNTGIDRKYKPLTGPDVDSYMADPWHASRANRFLIKETMLSKLPIAERLNLLGQQFMQIKRQTRPTTRYGKEFVRTQLKPAIREARRAGMTARDISKTTGYRIEYVYLIWGPIPGDPDWMPKPA